MPSLFISFIKSRKIRWIGTCYAWWRREIFCGILMAKPEEKEPLERPGFRWGNNVITNIK